MEPAGAVQSAEGQQRALACLHPPAGSTLLRCTPIASSAWAVSGHLFSSARAVPPGGMGSSPIIERVARECLPWLPSDGADSDSP